MILHTLQRHFGYNAFRPGQERVISTLINGRSAAAIFPTGSGKSLCYQLPALHMPHLTLVISPLLALMQDQVTFLLGKGINAASIDSSMSRDEVNRIIHDVKTGRIKILMVAVERLKNERFRHFIKSVPVSLMVVDEAHCISEWGHNFRPDYLKLPQYQAEFKIPQVLLLTATATPEVIGDMTSKFDIGEGDVTLTGFYRPNLRLLVEGISDKNKLFYLENWLFHKARFKPQYRGTVRDKKNKDAHIAPTVIYVTLQKTAETLAQELVKMGFHAQAYHAGMNSEERHLIQTDFMANHIEIVVATIAFGMGIDKADIRNVVHYDLPKSIENYSQEIGRAGRDGKSSDCLVLANRDSLQVLENFIYGDTPELSGIRKLIIDINQNTQQTGFQHQWECQLYSLSTQTNIRTLPLKTLLVHLEMLGLIQPLYSYFAEYKFKLLISEQDLLNRFEGERREFVSAVLAYSKQAKIWWQLDVESILQNYEAAGGQANRERVIKAVEYFEEQGWLELQSKQMTEVYEVCNLPIDLDTVSQQMFQYFEDKQQKEIARIHNMLAMFETNTCLSYLLAQYFGDHDAPRQCGHCSVCQGHHAQLPEAQMPQVTNAQDVSNLATTFISHYYQTYQHYPSAVLVTRFLCGITTPVFLSLKARALTGFATLDKCRYQDVLALVGQNSSLE